MVRAALQSPDFLYRLETTSPANAGATQVPLSSYELATRLSFLLWSSGPDDALLDAAARGELSSKAQVAAKAREMLAQPASTRGHRRFLRAVDGRAPAGRHHQKHDLVSGFLARAARRHGRRAPSVRGARAVVG